MAKVKNGTLYYQLYKNKISGSQAYGKWYAKAKHIGTVSFEELVDHMTEHNLGFPRGTIHGVMMGFVDCVTELLAQSKKVEIGDLGTLYLDIKSKGADTYKDFSATDNITSCGLDFLPNAKKSSDMSRTAWSSGMAYKNFTSMMTDEQKAAYLKEIGAETEETDGE